MKNIAFFQLFKTNSFVQNVTALFSANALGQLFPFLALPLLVLFYSTTDFAFYFMFSAIAMLLPLITSFKLELAFVTVDEPELKDVFSAGIWLSITLSLLYTVFFGLANEHLLRWIGMKDPAHDFRLIALSSFMLTIGQLIEYMLNRRNSFKQIAIIRVIRSTSTVLMQLVLGYFWGLTNGLILGMLAGQFIYLCAAIAYSQIQTYFVLSSFSNLLRIWKKHRGFSFYVTLTNAINVFSDQLPLFLFSRFLGPNYTAQYGMSNRVGVMPANLAAFSLSQVFYKHAADKLTAGNNIRESIKKLFKNISILAIAPGLIVMIASPFLFPLFFGEEWRMAGYYLAILMPMVILSLYTGASSSLVYVRNRQKELFYYALINAIVRVIAFLLCYYITQNHWLIITVFSLLGCIYHSLLIRWMLVIAK